MAEFSYESDIAPLRGDMFRGKPVPVGVDYQRFLSTKKMVEDVYGIDIKMYNYSFEDMI